MLCIQWYLCVQHIVHSFYPPTHLYNNTWVYFLPTPFLSFGRIVFWPIHVFIFMKSPMAQVGLKREKRKAVLIYKHTQTHTTRNLHCWMSFCLCACDLVLYLLPPGRKTAHSYTQYLGSAFALVVVVVFPVFFMYIYAHIWSGGICVVFGHAPVCVCVVSTTASWCKLFVRNTPSSPPNIWSLLKLT